MHDELVAALSRDHGVHPYGKWRGAFWRLLSLVDLGVPPGQRGAVDAASQTLDWLASPRRLRRIHERVVEGRVRRCASQEGRALHACVQLGMRDERLATLAESLVATQWPDGGWNCDIRPEASHSSFNETWGPILGLAAIGATDAAERGAEFLLEHRVYRSHRTGRPANDVVTKLHYPPYWHYDVLAGLTTLRDSVGLDDARTADALDLLESKRGPDARWHAEGRWWKPPGANGSNVEAVDWTPAADDLLTERATRVLLAAGRL